MLHKYKFFYWLLQSIQLLPLLYKKDKKVVIIDGFDGSYVFESHLEEYGWKGHKWINELMYIQVAQSKSKKWIEKIEITQRSRVIFLVLGFGNKWIVFRVDWLTAKNKFATTMSLRKCQLK